MDSTSLMNKIRGGEDSTLELKRIVWRGAGKINEPHPDGLADELAAFANAKGGLLVLGVDDKTREIMGIADQHLDEVESWLCALARDLIEPSLLFYTQHVALPDASGEMKYVIAVDVPRSLWIHKSPKGYMLRIGHEKRAMASDLLARMFQQRSQARLIRFEELPVPQAPKFEALPWRNVKPFLRTSEGAESTQFKRLHLLTEHEGGDVLTVAGVLLACENPSEYIRGAFIQAVAHRGLRNDPSDQIDAKDFTGPLAEQIASAFGFVMRHMLVPATKDLGRVDFPQYSRRAIFEAVVNAVAHRDYSLHGAKIRLHMFADRIEICVPGPLTNSMTVEAMTRMSMPRNDVLCSMLSHMPVPAPDLGREFLMDRRGSGVEVILDESKKISGKSPQYRQIDNLELQLTIYAAPSPHIEAVVA